MTQLTSEDSVERPRVVILGAGFGGLWTALALRHKPVDVLLVDRHNYHTFQALLYQVAAAELEAEQVAYPVRGILRKLRNVRFAMADVTHLDLEQRCLRSDAITLPYDYLVVACGSVTHYFNVPGAEEYGFPLKTLEHSVVLRNHVLSCFERASLSADPQLRSQLLTFVIVGGGSTGVEFAGALAELISGPLMKDHPEIERREVRVVLLEASDRLLPGLPANLQDHALNRLRGMGVDMRLVARVTSVTPSRVDIDGAEPLPSSTTIWTAGVRGAPVVSGWGLPVTRGGRVPVLPTLQVPEHPEVYVIGDLTYLEENGQPLPMVAPVAIQQGKWAAENITRQAKGQEPLPFRYQDPGRMATIGRNAAVVQLGRRTFTGRVAWVLWLAVHLMRLVGFRNRLLVLINWAWDYFLFERGIRLILPCECPPELRHE